MTTIRAFGRYALLGFTTLIVLVAYSSWGRPIWIDEFLHFAFGAMSPTEALQTISASATGVNHGQTGLLFLVNSLLLNAMGASLLALRAPSILAALLLIASAIVVIRTRGFGLPWQLLMIVAFAGQSELMYFAGEARPYMILASTTMATLAYYLLPVAARPRWYIVLLGVYGVVIGAANHPYYPVLLVMIIVFGIGVAHFDDAFTLSRTSVMRFLNLPLVAAAGITYLVIGLLTWMPGRPEFALDPWEWVGGPVGGVRTFAMVHFQLVGELREFKLALLALVIVAVVTMYSLRANRALIPPATLVVLGLVSSFVVSLASYGQSYWVLPRQWVAGIALVTVGVVWLLAELFRRSAVHHSLFLRFVVLLTATYVLVTAASSVYGKLSSLREHESFWQDIATKGLDPGDLAAAADSNDAWVEAANVNVGKGGPVRPEFRRYYGLQVQTRSPSAGALILTPEGHEWAK